MLSEERKKRIDELFERSYNRGVFTFTDFMSPTSLAEAVAPLKKGTYTVFGGGDYCERAMIRFGSEEQLGYCDPFPITYLKVSLRGGRFATQITHRDVLGATLNLGIERQKLGDIFINEGVAYIVAHKSVANLILLELKSIGRNSVDVEEIDALPDFLAPTLTEKRFSVSSNRADAIICKLYGLSREEGAELFARSLVSVNGKICALPSKSLSGGQTVAVRGYGKFQFSSEDGLSKKGKPYVTVFIYD